MDTVIALCHFCEHHGPSIVFCCERDVAEHEVSPDSGDELHTSVSGKQKTSVSDDADTSSSTSKDSALATAKQSKETLSRKTNFCQACRSLADGSSGYVIHDHQTGAKYIGTQHPRNPDIYSLVRQACVRSLSCEVCQGHEGPILFGDEQSGYVISYTFYLKDYSARGQQSWYSIICMMPDRMFLIQSWPFLVGCIGKIIKHLQVS